MNSCILSIDIGGTKIAAGVIDQAGSLSQYLTIPTNTNQGGEAIINQVIHLCKTILSEMNTGHSGVAFEGAPLAIGVSSAGQINSRQGKVIFATDNLPGWTGMEIKKRLEADLQLPVFVENDVNCVALGEFAFGAGKGYRHMLCLAIGTGIGGALIINGELYHGWKGSAGELGHICIDYQGRQCICGARGCLEAYVAGPAIEKEYFRKLSKRRENFIEDNISMMRLEEIAKLARAGNSDAQAVIKDAGYFLGFGLYGLLNTLNPEIVVIGGGVIKIGESFLEEARRVVASNALEPMRNTPIVAAQLEGAHANLIGAAVFCWQQLDTQLPK